jgi:hypothetical protein
MSCNTLLTLAKDTTANQHSSVVVLMHDMPSADANLQPSKYQGICSSPNVIERLTSAAAGDVAHSRTGTTPAHKLSGPTIRRLE